MSYPYDPQTRDDVARLLYQALPAMYRVQDDAPRGRGELRRFLKVLAAPLATLRQSIEELHADLFIDTAADWVIPYLADMVGTTLVFPDADKNRRDVRETVGWRQRKGTPAMLEEMASWLAEQLVVTREGWKLVQVTQDLDLPRPGRALPDLRDARIAETAVGPRVTAPHLADLRAVSRTTGKFHPLHVFHWAHPTLLYELRAGLPAQLTVQGDPDLRYAFHPAGASRQLRARRVTERDPLLSDRVLPLHFAADPGDWFGREGRFSVAICGLTAAVARPCEEPRSASLAPASTAITAGEVTIDVLAHDRRRFYGPLIVEVGVTAVPDSLPGLPDAFVSCAQIDLDDGPTTASSGFDNELPKNGVVMIHILPRDAGARFFPGATVEIRSSAPGARLAAESAELASEGFLRGALFVTLPPTHVVGHRWLYLAADGSVVDAQTTAAQATGEIDLPLLADGDGGRLLDRRHLLASGPGAAWPPLGVSRDPDPWPYLLPAPEQGPVVMHGGRVLQDLGHDRYQQLDAGTTSALVFALSYLQPVGDRAYRPFVRLRWQGTDPSSASWTVTGDDGRDLPDVDGRFIELAEFRAEGRPSLRLAVRFESAAADAVLTPSEVAWTSRDGRTVLLHLPLLVVAAGSPVAWGTDAAAASAAFYAGRDGSTWSETTSDIGRAALGGVAPLARYPALRRRRVAGRRLCPRHHDGAPAHSATTAGYLDVDVERGLFALALAEPPQTLPPGPADAPATPAVTVRCQQGYSAEIGALPAPREPVLDRRLAPPTRLVTRSGHLHRNAPADFDALPRYRSLGAALAAAINERESRTDENGNVVAVVVVIQFEDSHSYPDEHLTWPAGIDQLTIQAAEQQRPWLEIASWNVESKAHYQSLGLLGVALGAEGEQGDALLALPPAAEIALELVTVTAAGNTLVFADGSRVVVRNTLASGLRLDGRGTIEVRDSVVDTGRGLGRTALASAGGHMTLDRVTVFGTTDTRVLDASEVYFEDDVKVTDRFAGCVRYSRVTGASMLPHVHRLVSDVAADFVSVDRHDPAHARLAESTDPRILRGAEDGGEIGAFHDARLAQVYAALLRRLLEYTPAGLVTGVLRSD